MDKGISVGEFLRFVTSKSILKKVKVKNPRHRNVQMKTRWFVYQDKYDTKHADSSLNHMIKRGMDEWADVRNYMFK